MSYGRVSCTFNLDNVKNKEIIEFLEKQIMLEELKK